MEFIASASPLLDQFLEATRGSLLIASWGVSAQGGDYELEMSKLASIAVPSHRVIVVPDEGERHSDLTQPLRWLVAGSG